MPILPLDLDPYLLADDYDSMTFEERDEVDALAETELRSLVSGLPARPGTRR